MPNIGIPELLIVLVVLLVVFGPKRLPGLGRQLGSGMREFKDGIAGKSRDDEDDDPFDDEPAKALPAAGSTRVEPDVAAEATPPEAQDAPVRRDA